MGSCVKLKHPNVSPREASYVIQKLKNFLLGRKLNTNLRYAEILSCKTQPPPNLPDGPSCNLFENYYFSRNARDDVRPPVVLYKGNKYMEDPPPNGDDDCECLDED
uniref:NADH dehydrogenase [ubiquinone] 1 alpha subcomplex subunit 7 n=1 Tax=Clastoptera arizonana TaxID=38151 RepID=A0A1B6DZV9_9HEMI